MILRFGVGVALAIIACVAIMVLFGWLWKKMNKKIAAGATIGFFVGIFASVAIIVVPSRAYVVTGSKEFKHYLVFGSSSYTMSSGQEVDLNSSGMHCVIVNDSSTPLVLEEVVYGFGYGSTYAIDPLSSAVIDGVTIDYFFDDEPPASIESSTSGDEIRLWLREQSLYDLLMDEDTEEDLEELFEEESYEEEEYDESDSGDVYQEEEVE